MPDMGLEVLEKAIEDLLQGLEVEDSNEEFALLYKGHKARVKHLGTEVHLRGIIEFSNYCRQDCLYCGLRRSNGRVKRYRMLPDKIIEAAEKAMAIHKFGTFVLQSGEDPSYPPEDLARVVAAIKDMGAAVTLSVGQWPYEEYKLWKDAGCDRFLLKFETSDPVLFHKLKPTTTLKDRLDCFYDLRELGYQVGTGIILGLPGQTSQSIVGDLNLISRLNPEMVSIGPYIPHPDTPLGTRYDSEHNLDPTSLIRAVLDAIAVSRIMVPYAHIPATTALGVLGKKDKGWIEFGRRYVSASEPESVGIACFEEGCAGLETWNDPRALALMCGANVIMPDITPEEFRASYDIYPGKADSDGTNLSGIIAEVKTLVSALGMNLSPGRGDSCKPQFNQGKLM